VAHERSDLRTDDGLCPSSVFKPDRGTGPRRGTIFFMDGLGIRPTLFAMSPRLADARSVVLLSDLFYRAGPYEPIDVQAVLPRRATQHRRRAEPSPARGDIRGRVNGAADDDQSYPPEMAARLVEATLDRAPRAVRGALR
jgi:dienelactone hydrolase